MDVIAKLQSKQKSNLPPLHYGENLNDVVIFIPQLLGKALPKPTIQQPTKSLLIAPRRKGTCRCKTSKGESFYIKNSK